MLRRIITEKRISRRTSLTISFLALAFLLGWGARSAHATPSTTYWTPDVMDIQGYNVWHIGIDNYYTIGQPKGKEGAFPTDVGLTVGVLPFTKVNMEVGIALLEPMDGICGGAIDSATGRIPITNCTTVGDALLFNAKIGIPEGAFLVGSRVSISVFSMSVLNHRLPTWTLST